MAIRSATALLALSAGCQCALTSSNTAARLAWSPPTDPIADLSSLVVRSDVGLTRSAVAERSVRSRDIQSTPVEAQLVSRDGFMLEIGTNGRVEGSIDRNSRFGILRLMYMITTTLITTTRSTEDSLLKIQAAETDLWLCMRSRGALYTKNNGRNDLECEFRERRLSDGKRVFYSNKYPLVPEGQQRTNFYYVALHRRTGRARSRITGVRPGAEFIIRPIATTPRLPTLVFGSDYLNDAAPSEQSGRKSHRGHKHTRSGRRRTRPRGLTAPQPNSISDDDIFLTSIEAAVKRISNRSSARTITYSSGLQLPDPTSNLINIEMDEALRHPQRKIGRRRTSISGLRQYQRAQNKQEKGGDNS